MYAAIGNSGNVIYVNPDTNIVVAVSSYFKPTVLDRVDFIEEVLLPTREQFVKDRIELLNASSLR